MLRSDDGELISFLFTEGETQAPAHRHNSSHSAEFCIYHLSDQLTSHFQPFVCVEQKLLRYGFQFKPEPRLNFPQCFETLSRFLPKKKKSVTMAETNWQIQGDKCFQQLVEY